jgi:hypothetical protein
VYRAYILSKSARSPRFRTERENWVQRVVADGHAICILPERSAAAPGLVTRPIEGLFGAGIGDRDGLGIDHSGRDAEDRATRLDVRMEVRTLTFFLSTPGVAEATAGAFPAISAAPGQFLLKDLVLLAASLSLLFASVQGPWLNVQKS